MSRTPNHTLVDQDPRFAMQIVNLDSGRRALEQDIAYEGVMDKTREVFKKHGKVGGFIRAVWYSNIGRDLLQHRGKREATKSVRKAGGNYLTLVGGSEADFGAESAAVVERFSESISNQFMLDHGETNQELREGAPQHAGNLQADGALLRDRLKQVIVHYAEIPSDNPDDGLDDLKHHVESIIKDYGPRAMVSYGHNIYEVARNARQARRHGEDMARISKAMTAHYGVARTGVRTGQQREMVDAANSGRAARIAEAVGRNGLYAANEGTLGAALTVGLIASRAAVRGATGTLTRAATFGLAGGAIAGARTYREEGRRQRFLRRQWAAGKESPEPEDGPRVNRRDNIKYNSVKACDLYFGLDAIIKDLDGSDPATVEHALNFIAEAQARRVISNRDGVDLITYADQRQIERERTLLYKRLDQAIEAVQRIYDNRNANQPMPARHGPRVHTPEGNPGSMVDARMHRGRGGGRASIYQELMDDIQQKNRAARNWRLGKAAMIGAIGGLVGGGIGYGAGELMNIFGGAEHAVTGQLHEHVIHGPGGTRTAVKLSDHVKLNYHPGFHSEIVDNGHSVTHNFGWDRQGDTVAHARDAMRANHELVRQGQGINHGHLFVGADGKVHSRFVTEIWSPQDWHNVSQATGAVPIYFLNPLEKMKGGHARNFIPEAQLSTETLTRSYLKSFDQRTGEMIDEMAQRLKAPRNQDKVAENPKAVITITADASKNNNQIFSLLAQYARQVGVDTARDIEIVVVVAKRSNRATQLTRELERFQQGLNRHGRPIKARYRNLKVRVIEEVIPTDKRSSRRIDEVANGAVVSDLASRGINLDETVMLMNGADTKKVDPHYIETVLKEMNQVPDLDILVGQRGRPRGADPARRPDYSPRAQRFSRMVERNTLKQRPNFMGVSKANIAFRPRAFMTPDRRRFELGSYDYNSEIGAMVK